MKKMVGVIGGMGPATTVDYMQQIIKLSSANTDQEHVPLCVWNDPRIPDRSNAILTNNTDKVSDYLISVAKRLENNNCLFLTMPCNTAHYWAYDIKKSVKIPFIDMIEETIEKINELGYKTLALLSTKGTKQAKIYEKYANKYNIIVRYPNEINMKKISDIIYKIKGGNYNKTQCIIEINQILANMGADCTVLGCTELSIIYKSSHNIFDPLNILARKTIELWNNLVTNIK